MLKRHKHSWSHNELFAHKKNAGEQAKLRDTMLRIERKFGMVKDSIRHEASQVRTSLKSLRKSTGHSIDALPPTPFQLRNFRDDTFVSVALEPVCDSGRSQTNPEFDYILDEVSNEVSNQVVNDTQREVGHFDNKTVSRQEENNIVNKNGQVHPSNRSIVRSDLKIDGSTIDPDNNVGRNVNFDTGKRTTISPQLLPKQKSTLFPPIEHEHLVVNSTQRKAFENAQSHVTIERPIGDDVEINSATDKTHCPSSPRSKENSTLTTSSERQLPSSFWSSPLSMTRTNSFSASNNRSNARSGQRFVQQRKDNGENDKNASTTKKDNENPKVMRDTRTRCRTCLERYRQNLEFRRQKKLLEREQMELSIAPGIGKTPQLGGAVDKSFLVTDDDLNSLFAESAVLDFEETETHLLKRSKMNNLPRGRGYSRLRLQQLAEPRLGRRKKPLFSKQLIKREVDDMTERHSQPQLTEREKERIRILESKIRMFLAVTSASGDVMPSSMVHIPQREDVMTVDISHH